ncbi:MAG: ABC transporter permease [Thiobacillaceae bacterium]
MKLRDTLTFSAATLYSQRIRSLLIIAAMAVGVGAVVVLTALGDGARLYVLNQFASIGTNILIVLPGHAETTGAMLGAITGETTRDLTLDDARALLTLPQIKRLAPLNVGTTEITSGGILKEAIILGSTTEFLAVRHMELGGGHFIETPEWDNAAPQVVLGTTLARDLFPGKGALGQWVHLGDRRFRVVGTLAPQGEAMGFNTDDIAIIPVNQAQSLLNTSSLFRIMIEAKNRTAIEPAKAAVIALLKQRHEGEEDITVITQDAILSTFDKILRALTLAVGGIAAISLAVAGILVMNVMLVAVTQRRSEIGLLKALGAQPADIRRLFFTESALLSLLGAVVGLALGYTGSVILRATYPTLPAYPPLWAAAAGVATALITGVVFALLPANRAARLDPVATLGGK